MEIHWIAALLTVWWLPKGSPTHGTYNPKLGSDWTIDKAKLVYHFSSTEQYNANSRQAKNIFPIQQQTPNRHADNSQSRFFPQQQFQTYNGYNGNSQQGSQQQQPSTNYGNARLTQYPPVTNQFASQWGKFPPPAPSPPPILNQQREREPKITRPSLPDLLPAILENQNVIGGTNIQNSNYQFSPNVAPVYSPQIDARIVSRPNKTPLVVPTPTDSPQTEYQAPQFSPPLPTPQHLVNYQISSTNNHNYNISNNRRPSPVYPPVAPPNSQEEIDSQGQLPPTTTTEAADTHEHTQQTSISNNPDREIRFLIHKPGDEEIIKNAISEDSKFTHEQVSFIQGPNIQLQRRQKIYLPPKKKTVVYILLKEPQIDTDVEVMEPNDDPKPEVFVIYQKGKEMLTRHYSADSNTLKTVKSLQLPAPISNRLLAGAASARKETVVKAPDSESSIVKPITMCLSTPVTSNSRTGSSSNINDSSANKLVKTAKP